MVSADKRGALGQLSTIRNSSMLMDLAAAHAHRVDHGHAAGGDIVAVAYPAGRFQPISWPRSAPACLTSANSVSASGVDRLGRAGEAAVAVRSRRHALPATAAIASSSNRCAACLISRASPGRILTRRMARSGTTLFGPAALDPRRIDAEPRPLRRGEPQREVGGGEQGVAAVLGIAPGMGAAAADGDREIAASRPRAGERPVGQSRRLVSQRRPLAPRGLGDQRRRAEASRLPRR